VTEDRQSESERQPVARWLHHSQRAAWRVVDMVLPPRCAACGMIVTGSSGFCPDCWAGLDFLVGPACARCDLPLAAPAGEGALCGGCMQDLPPYARVRAVLAYGDVPRMIVTRLKFGRRMGFARLMARLM